MPEPSLDELAGKLSGFQILEKTREDGTGSLYKALQVSLGRVVALKVFSPELARQEEFARNFDAESRAAAQVKHPNLIEIFDVGHIEGIPYCVMEYCEGETVADKLRREGPMRAHAALTICLGVARALQPAWEQAQIIHGDLKPESLLLERQTGVVRVADLGIARSIACGVEQASVATGLHSTIAPFYIAPERARGDAEFDFRADMYSLGATLYHMLTGKAPFEGLSAAVVLANHMQGHLPDPRTIRAGISEPVVVVLERMMAKNPHDRYPHWATLAHDLAQVCQARAPAVGELPPGRSTIQRIAYAPAPSEKPRAKKRVSALRIAVELALLLVVLAGIYWYYRNHPFFPTEGSNEQPVRAPTSQVAVTRAVTPPTFPSPAPGEATPTIASPAEPRPPREPPAGFTPASIAGLRMWLSADKNVARDEDNRVSAWGDHSGQGQDARQPSLDHKPLYVPDAIHGKPALRFDGTNDYLEFTPIDTTSFTVCIVFRMTAMKPWAGPMNNRADGKHGFQIVSGHGQTNLYIPAIVKWNGETEVGVKKATNYFYFPFGPAILSWTSEADDCCGFFRDGVQESLVDSVPNWLKPGGMIGYGFDYIAGDIAEVLVYDKALALTDLRDVERYLNGKYAIVQSGLPAVSPQVLAELRAQRVAREAEAKRSEEETRTKQLAEQKLREATARYATWRSSFQQLVARGDFEKAREAVSQAQNDPQLVLVKGGLARDERIVELMLRMRDAAWKDLPGKPYAVGAASGTVSRIETDKFWVKLAAGEVAVPFASVDVEKLPGLALAQNPKDPSLNLAAGLLCWFRGDRSLAQKYFAVAAKGGIDAESYLGIEPTPSAP